MQSLRRFSTAARRVGAVFDIDGVLLRGHKALPGARDSLLRLQQQHVPFIFLTNGGGVLESAKADELSTLLVLDIHEEQVVVAHSPVKSLVPQFQDKRVLILGCKNVLQVAHTYGFQQALVVEDIAFDDPTRFPFFHFPHRTLSPPLDDSPQGRIHAVLILHDPIHWAVDLQVACDVIRGGSPLGSGSGQSLPVYACNPDFVFAGAYPVPRFAAGSFTRTLSYLFQELTGQQLQVQHYGKPLPVTFDFALSTLNRWRAKCGQGTTEPLTSVYMVGDNPKADVRGANAAGSPWRSVLVETGVYKPVGAAVNDPEDPAMHVCANVSAAVSVILS